MYPTQILSLHKGWDLLTKNNSNEWESIQNILAEISLDDLLHPSDVIERKRKEKKEANEQLEDKVIDYNEEEEEEEQEEAATEWKADGNPEAEIDNAYHLEHLYSRIAQDYGWDYSEVISKIKSKFALFNSMDKNKVITHFLSNSFTANGINEIIYVLSTRSVALGKADVNIVLAPDESLNHLFRFKINKLGNKGIGEPYTGKDCQSHLTSLYPITNGGPMVFVFFSLEKKEFEIEELPVDQVSSIDRALVFPPEYYQAGVTVLSHFGEIVRQKYPNIKAKVRIEQDGNIVRMHVELPNGEVETVEKILEKYFLIIREEALPSTLFDNKLQIMALENKLDMVKTELRSTERVLKLALESKDEMKNAHQQAVTEFQHIIGEQSMQINTLIQLSSQQTASHERIQIAQIGHTSNLFMNLIGEAHGNQVTLDAIRTLQSHLLSGIALIDVQDQINEAMTSIKQETPSLLEHISGQLEGASYGAVASYVLDWISKHG
jgi:hypothetical protein